MRRILPFLGLALAGSAFAQNVLQDPHQPFPFLPLQYRAGGTWFALWNPATQTPRNIYGTGLPLADWRGSSLEEARRQANLALVAYGDLLGLGASEPREIIGARMGRAWSFTFAQYFRGLPAVGGRADVRINANGTLALLGSTFWPIPADFDVTPKIDETAATAAAWFALGAEPLPRALPAERKPQLVIWGDVEAPQAAPFHLAWEIPIDTLGADDRGLFGRSYVDARTGRVLSYQNDHHDGLARRAPGLPAATAPAPAPAAAASAAVPPAVTPTTVTVMGYTRTGLSAIGPLANIPLRNLVVAVPGLGTRTTDGNGQFSIDIAAPVTITVGALDGVHNSPILGSDTPSAFVNVQPGVPATLQLLTAAATQEQAAHTSVLYWIDRVNEWARTILGNTAQLNAINSITPNVNIAMTCNASYGGNQVNYYAQGGGCNNSAFSTVIMHEWGHGLDAQYGGISNNLGDGLSEGWGDIIAMYMVDDPIVGLDFRTGGIIRTGDNTRTYPPPSEVHQAGEVWMGFAWHLRQNLRSAFGSSAIGISNDIVVGSIVANATNQPDAVLQVFVADDDNGNLLDGTPHYAQLSAAAIVKNLPYPQLQTGVVTHTALSDTNAQYVPRQVVATLTPAFGSFSGMTLHFSAPGQTNVVRNMFPTGSPNQYQALLPGLGFGNTVTYHFEAAHSSGGTLRYPLSGEILYRVTNDLLVYRTDFESGAPGWTHAMLATQDDWQLGDPAGQSGTGWADPQTAASGVNEYGNDLGNTIGTQLWNGAYQNNVVNFLRSPSLNCTGRTGVRLKFKRWLTVQASPLDNATISVNGVQAWVNPGTGNLVDTGWQSVELPIPMADNNPLVTIEWRLTTNASTVFGGWNIDDVEVVADGPTLPPLLSILRLQPEQAPINAPLFLTVLTPGPKPLLVAFGPTPGPTLLPGIPALQVGGGLATLFATSNAFGLYSQTFNGPAFAAATGTYFYSQALTLDAGGNIIASNPCINFFTPTP